MFRSIAVVAAALSLSGPALARASGTGPRGRTYDPATEQTVAGEVREVKLVPSSRSGGVHLELATASGPIDVHVGPSWFLERSSLTFARGDRIEVTGSRVALKGGPALVARTVTKGGAVVTLRDKAGVPAWAGGRGR